MKKPAVLLMLSVSSAGQLPFCTHAGTGLFVLRPDSNTSTTLRMLHEQKLKHEIRRVDELAVQIIPYADAAEYEYLYSWSREPSSMTCRPPAFSAAAARECLRGRRVKLIGDSILRGTAFADETVTTRSLGRHTDQIVPPVNGAGSKNKT